MLSTPKTKVNGPAFLVGWVVGLTVVGVVLLLVSGNFSLGEEGQPTTGASYMKLGLGMLLLVVAHRQFSGRPRNGAEPDMTGWMESAIAQSGAATDAEIGALAAFVVIATLGPSIPVGIYFFIRERAEKMLGDAISGLSA